MSMAKSPKRRTSDDNIGNTVIDPSRGRPAKHHRFHRHRDRQDRPDRPDRQDRPKAVLPMPDIDDDGNEAQPMEAAVAEPAIATATEEAPAAAATATVSAPPSSNGPQTSPESSAPQMS